MNVPRNSVLVGDVDGARGVNRHPGRTRESVNSSVICAPYVGGAELMGWDRSAPNPWRWDRWDPDSWV